MLSLAQNLLKTSHEISEVEIKPLTLVFWTDFMTNPSILYGLFSPTPRKLNYDPERVKVMGTKDGMISQINIRSIEDLDSIHEEVIGNPLLLRIWAEFTQNNYTGSQTQVHAWEGDMALLVDTAHPMIRPELENGLDEARNIIQTGRKFCLQVDFGPAIDEWIKKTYPRGCCAVGSVRSHRAILYITNYDKPVTCFRCNALWCILFGPCWLLSAPCYKIYRACKCKDIKVYPMTSIVRRTVSATGKIVEVKR